MKYNQLGRTGIFVSELCLGTMTMGGNEDAGMWKSIGTLGQNEANHLIEVALGNGINFIDTADIYSFGQSERLVGQALRHLDVKREDVVIATKSAAPMGDGPNQKGASRGHIFDSVAKSLERLQLEHIDLYQIHISDSVTTIEETLRALDDLTRQGLVRYVGVSNWRAGKLGKALGLSASLRSTRFETLQAYYSIASREIERELVPLVNDEKLGLLVWSPLSGGLLSGKYGPDATAEEGSRRISFDFPPVDKNRAWACVAEMRKIAHAHEVSVARIALAWVLAKKHVTSVIVGAKTPEQLRDNIGAVNVQLSSAEVELLDQISALSPEYPTWMIEYQDGIRRPAPFEGTA